MTSDTTPLSPLRKGSLAPSTYSLPSGLQSSYLSSSGSTRRPPSSRLVSAPSSSHLVTKGKVPIFLGSSFAFIAPIIKATELYGLSGALFGCIGVSAVYFVMSLLIRLFGLRFISRLFPPVVIGPHIMLIGLSLSDSAVKMAATNWPLAVISLATAIIVTLYGRGITKLIPIFLGIVVGYIADLIFFEVDLRPIAEASWLSLPKITIPENFSFAPILFMIPVAIAPVIEHIGDVYVVNNVAGRTSSRTPACTARCSATVSPVSSPHSSGGPPCDDLL